MQMTKRKPGEEGYTYSLKDSRLRYMESSGKDISLWLYKKIIFEFLTAIMLEVLIKGGKFHMGYGLSYIQIRRRLRNFTRPMVHWSATDKLRDENGILPIGDDGQRIRVYHTSPWFIWIYWCKKRSNTFGKKVYAFRMLRGKHSIKQHLINAMATDDLAYLNFEFYDPKKTGR